MYFFYWMSKKVRVSSTDDVTRRIGVYGLMESDVIEGLP